MPIGDYETTTRPEEINAPRSFRYGFSNRTMVGDETWDTSAATYARLSTGGVDRVVNLYDPVAYRGLFHEVTAIGPGSIVFRYNSVDVETLSGGQRVELRADSSGWVVVSRSVAVASESLVEVCSQSDLPAPVAGVITLAADTAYHFTCAVTLDPGVRLVCAGIVAIYGTSSETASISGSGLSGNPLISSEYSLPMRDISITASGGPAVLVDGLSGGSVAAVDWRAVNFVDCAEIGTIKNVTNFIQIDSAHLNSGGMKFDGTIGTVGFDSSLFEGRASTISIKVEPTASITRRLRIITSSFVILSGETGISISDPSVFANKESYILDFCNFAGGGTYLSGTTASNSEALFTRNVGIDNSAAVAHYYMNNNATATAIGVAGTPVKVAGTTSSGPLVSEFDQSTSNRAIHEGVLTEYYVVNVYAACSAGNNQILSLYVAEGQGAGAATVRTDSQMRSTANGTGRVESIATQCVLLMSTDSYFEIWVANESGTTDVTVTDLQVIARRIS